MFVMANVAGMFADRLIRRGLSLTTVRKLMQTVGLIGPSVFLILASSAATPGTALLLMCGALGTLACTWSGYAPNHLEIAPRHAAVLMGITNTAGIHVENLELRCRAHNDLAAEQDFGRAHMSRARGHG